MQSECFSSGSIGVIFWLMFMNHRITLLFISGCGTNEPSIVFSLLWGNRPNIVFSMYFFPV